LLDLIEEVDYFGRIQSRRNIFPSSEKLEEKSA
jgi:hypothetical protein